MKKNSIKNKVFKGVLIITGMLLLSNCASVAPRTKPGTGSIQELQEINLNSLGKMRGLNVPKLRYAALKDMALSLGAQAGLAWRGKQINHILTGEEKRLNNAYNFYGLLLTHDILPPVLEESDTTLNLADPDTIRLSDKIYRIVNQARFVTAPPTWRDYLWINFTEPTIPENSFLPRTKIERDMWRYYVAHGWKNGVAQANEIFSANLARLNRDYKGMILYRKLYSEHMVSAPYVSKTELGITGNSNEMNIGDRILRITSKPELNLQGNTWKPAIVKQDNSSKEPMGPYYQNGE
ncbi:MAG: type IV secretory system conjugative DNA transfer family protein [Gammaproteobacteria bacterium]